MNIYDFDNTIFKGDSSVKFIKYSFIRHPFIVIWSLIKTLKESIKYLFHKSTFDMIKSELFSFVKHIKNFDEYMNKFTEKNMQHIKQFYLDRKKDNDVVISASFGFIVNSFCERLGIKYVITSEYDIEKGHIIGKNCKGEEKVRKLFLYFKDPIINEAYSDSKSDIPMLSLGKKTYLVKNEELIELNLKENTLL